MPVSKHRKNHKKKVGQYKKNVLIAREQLKERLMREYMEKIQNEQQLKRQEIGETVINDDINVDLDVDLGIDDLNVQDVTPIEEDQNNIDNK
mgnify:CR=1 FL=1